MKNGTLVIASCANEKYATGLGVMMCSSLLCSKQRKIRFYILNDGILPETTLRLRDRVQRVARLQEVEVELNFIDFKRLKLPPLAPLYGSLTTYGRIFLSELLEDRSAFYVDADIICNREFPILEEFERQHPEALLVGCIDPLAILEKDCPWKGDLSEEEYKLPYINAGFLWMNMEGLRKFNLSEKFRILAEKGKPMRFVDQTALNYLCRGKIGLLPSDFNHMWKHGLGVKNADDGCNIHFTGPHKPWCCVLTEDSLLQIALFNVAASCFGFPKQIVSKVEARKISAIHCINLYVKLLFYKLTFSKRIEKSKLLMKKWRLMKSYIPAYEAKLRALMGTPFDE